MKWIIFPKSIPGNGMGHVYRAEQLKSQLSGQSQVKILYKDKLQKQSWAFDDILLLDQRQTSAEDFFCTTNIPVVALDEGGPHRGAMDYLIDTLPNLEKHPCNVRAFHKEFKQRKSSVEFPPKKILISFGGADEKNLSRVFLEFIKSQNLDDKIRITLIQGPKFQQQQWPDHIRVVKCPEDLDDEILKADLLITHFGLSCFEALYQGVPVLLIHPSEYHQALGRKAGLPDLGLNRIIASRFWKYFNQAEKTKALFRKILIQYCEPPPLLSQVLQNLNPEAINQCPLCRNKKNNAIGRFPNKTYFRCQKCSLIYAIPYSRRKNPYQDSYFFDEYQNQYGKTYLEDFDYIKKLSQKRLEIIKPMIKSQKNPRFLDIGCAFGPFIAAVLEDGFQAEGIEISPKAAEYVKEQFKVPCFCCNVENDFPEFDTPFDVISFWYVLEHFSQLRKILKNVNSSMKNAGILALALPNSQGISMKRNKRRYLKQHPDDHFTLWKPGTINKQLQLLGFKVCKIRISGHHPERFPFLGAIKALHPILDRISRIFGLGDTFEVYAQKVRNI